MSKLIGISTGLKNVDMAPGNIPCVVINNDFVKVCNNYGNTAVIFGPQENSESIDVSKFDAIVISGGGDINPNIYGEEKLEKTIRISDHRDSTELSAGNEGMQIAYQADGERNYGGFPLMKLDSPNTTSSVTYNVAIHSSNTWYINRSEEFVNGNNHSVGTSFITAMEVSA